MGNEKIFRVSGVASHVCVKIDASCSEPAGLQNNKHSFSDLIDVRWELIGIPAILIVAPVGIYAAEHSGVCGRLQVVLERMSRKGCMVDLHIQLEVLIA